MCAGSSIIWILWLAEYAHDWHVPREESMSLQLRRENTICMMEMHAEC